MNYIQLAMFGPTNLTVRRTARGRKPPPPRWAFTLDPAGERLVWMEKHDVERFAQLPDVVRKAAGWYGLARLAWLRDRNAVESWVSA